MKSLQEQYKEQMRFLEFCAYCTEPKGEQRSCCDENHWLELQDFDQETQIEIINQEIYQ